MIALHIPITAMLMGIVLRGSAFVFRKYDSTEDAVQRRWSTIFGIASFFTPFFQGLTLGALTTGAIRFVGDRVTTGFFAGRLTPFALTYGLFARALFAFPAAIYMTVDTQGRPDHQNDFRRRAIWAQTALIPPAIIGCTGVDLKAFAVGPRGRSGRPAAVTLSFSNLQRSRTALTPSSPSRPKLRTNRTCTCLHTLNPTNQAEPSQQSALAPIGEATSRKKIITIPPPGGVPPLASLRS
jgi:hypothetical protein